MFKKNWLKILIVGNFLSLTVLLLGGCNSANPTSYTGLVYDPRVDQAREELKSDKVNMANQTTSFIPINVIKKVQPLAGTQMGLDRQMDVRSPASVRVLTFGRYKDPVDPTMMHEASIAYQVQNSSQWNLRPNPPVKLPYGNIVRPPNWANTSPLYAELEGQLIKTKNAAGKFNEAKEVLMKNIHVIQNTNKNVMTLIAQNKTLHRQLIDAQKQITALEGSSGCSSEGRTTPQSTLEKTGIVYQGDRKVGEKTNSRSSGVVSSMKVQKEVSVELPESQKATAKGTAPNKNSKQSHGLTKLQLQAMLNKN